ncbi:hypothetical protein Slin15195_G106090 [Septoria linicola]|uniref:Uncharacterized protein n=1 Tax=Septoria linicola TaxID=215465 RepID=A0A9Q9AY66_9PEZI|nr:hypothetical protein Slin15195_G106090 [Septoria linicola]
MSRAQERVRRLAQLNQRPLPPAITYGTRRGNRIPLKGNQFLRPDPYDIPSDEDDEPPVASRHVKIGKTYSAKQPNADDSPLSEDQLEAVYGRDATPISSPPRRLTPSSRNGNEAQVPLVVKSVKPSTRRTIAQPTPARPVPEPPSEPQSTTSSFSVAKAVSRKRRTIPQRTPTTAHSRFNRKDATRPAHRARPTVITSSLTPDDSSNAHFTQRTGRTPASSKHTSTTESLKTKPHLPVGELLLVRSPSQAGFECDHISTVQGPEVQDPIADSSTRESSLDLRADTHAPSSAKAPLISIRKRIRPPKFTHRSVAALRDRQRARAPFFKASKDARTSGDGFEAMELKVSHPASIMKKRRARKPLTSGFSALTLRAGPLPDVDFSTSSVKCKEEESSHDVDLSMADDEGAHSNASTSEVLWPTQCQLPSFSNRVLDEAVAQKLSSVSAPRRVYSISSDDDEEDQGEDWLEPEVENSSETGGASFAGHDENIPQQANSGDQPTFSRLMRQALSGAYVDAGRPRDTGVNFDFRKSATPGTAARVPFDRRHLMGVDEMIDDELDLGDASVPAKTHNIQHEALVNIGRFQDEDIPVRQPQPRSILRRETPVVQDGATGPEHTTTNTRRNSMRAIEGSHYFHPIRRSEDDCNEMPPRHGQLACVRRNTEVELADESHYFSHATGKLRDQSQSKPRIIKQRSSEARRASYYSQQGVPIPDSDDAVLETSTAVRETSPEHLDYTSFSKLNVLKRNAETTWSSSLPKTPRDLKTLTRTVSREHGTLSQSTRRKPSLPFQSPVKVM